MAYAIWPKTFPSGRAPQPVSHQLNRKELFDES